MAKPLASWAGPTLLARMAIAGTDKAPYAWGLAAGTQVVIQLERGVKKPSGGASAASALPSSTAVRSAFHPATGQLLAGVENRPFGWPVTVVVVVVVVMAAVMVVVVTAAIGWRTPIRRRIVDGLGQLVAVLRVLLTQRVVLLAQTFAVGGIVGGGLFLCLLTRLLVTLVRRGLRVSLALLFLRHLFLMCGNALFVEALQMAGFGVFLREFVLAKAQVLVDDFAVVRLMDQLTFRVGAWPIGVFDVSALAAFVDVLSNGHGRDGQQHHGNQGSAGSGGQVHRDDHFAPVASRKRLVSVCRFGMIHGSHKKAAGDPAACGTNGAGCPARIRYYIEKS